MVQGVCFLSQELRMASQNSLDPEEIEKFEQTAGQWWDESGPSAPLHAMNPTRIGFILSQIRNHYPDRTPQDITIVDVGCGGGLVCEPLARLGFRVSGVDAGETAIKTAKHHAAEMGLDIRYLNTVADEIDEQFDVVLALEIIEHVADPAVFVQSLSRLIKPGGMLVLSTLNRTAKAYAVAILGAEYIARKLPVGTHEYDKFLTPRELEEYCETAALAPILRKGLVFDPSRREWALSDNTDINYFLVAKPE